MIAWIIDWVPWWTWYAIAAAAAIFTIPLWLPAVKTVWLLLPNWARFVLGGFVAAGTAYLMGRNKGRRNALDEQRRRDAQAIQRRAEIERQTDGMTPEQRSKERKRWTVPD